MTASDVSVVTALAELASQVRHGTLQLLDMADPAFLTWSPRGTSNHILWHAGHALWVQDALTIRPLTGRSELPAGWETTFGQGSRPATISRWPDASVVRDHLAAQLDRILLLLAENAEKIVVSANKIYRRTRAGRCCPASSTLAMTKRATRARCICCTS